MFFFFKQKTAYELRISDWSSDVCSSDLIPPIDPVQNRARPVHDSGGVNGRHITERTCCCLCDGRGGDRLPAGFVGPVRRSEEHTSELQLLIRLSYAVLRLKQQTTLNPTQQTTSLETQ